MMKASMFLLLLSIPAFGQQTQCPLRWMFQYDPAAQVNALGSLANDSTTSYLVALSGPQFPSTITPSVGWTVGAADSFGVFLRTDSGVFIIIQHEGVANTFVIDTAFIGPCAWHEVAVAVTPGQTNYSLMLYPVFPSGPLRYTAFGTPVYFGGAYQWNRAPVDGVSEHIATAPAQPVKWYNSLGVETDSLSPEAVIRNPR